MNSRLTQKARGAQKERKREGSGGILPPMEATAEERGRRSEVRENRTGLSGGIRGGLLFAPLRLLCRLWYVFFNFNYV